MTVVVRHSVSDKAYVNYPLENAQVRMDRGRLVFAMDEKISKDSLAAIATALRKAGICAVSLDTDRWLDIPLKNVENSHGYVGRTVRVLKQKSYIDPQIGNEILELWKFFPQTPYWSATTEGRVPSKLPIDNAELQKYAAEKVPLLSIPTPVQHVILFDLYAQGLRFNVVPGKFNRALLQVARTKDFYFTQENLILYQKGFTCENLLPAGPDGLNPIDLTLRSRNLALTRAMFSNVTIGFFDPSLKRALLNAILREIENCAHLNRSIENPREEFCKFLKEKEFTKNLTEVQRNELDAYISRLANAAVDVYAFLFGVLSIKEGTFSSPGTLSPIWIEFGNKQEVFSNFEKCIQLQKTLTSFIVDRALKFIKELDPTITKEIECQILQIADDLPFDSILSKAQSIVNDPSSDLAKMLDSIYSAGRVYPEVIEFNQMLGKEFTAKYGSKWRVMNAKKIFVDGFDETERSKYEAALTKGGLKTFQFIPHGNFFRLVASLLAEPAIDEVDRVMDIKKEVNFATPVTPSQALATPPKGFTPDQKNRLLDFYLEKAGHFLAEGKRVEATNCLDRFDGLNSDDTALLARAQDLRRQINQSASTSAAASMMIQDQ